MPVAQPGTDGQNPVLQTSLGERIWLGKGPIALLGGLFWPGNTLTYINPIRRNGGRIIGLCNGIL